MRVRNGEFVKIKVGEGRKALVFEGDLYSPEFCDTLKIIMQKYYGTELPKNIKKLIEPIR
jgi:hypothetical protein